MDKSCSKTLGITLLNSDCSCYTLSNLKLHKQQSQEMKNCKLVKRIIRLNKEKQKTTLKETHALSLKETLLGNEMYAKKNSTTANSLLHSTRQDDVPIMPRIVLNEKFYTPVRKKRLNQITIVNTTQQTTVFLTDSSIQNNLFTQNSKKNLKAVFIPKKFDTICTSHEYISPKREKIHDFLLKTKKISTDKFIQKFTREHILQLDESYTNNLEKEDTYQASLKAPLVLLNSYTDTFTRYLKSLIIEVETQRKILEKLSFKRVMLDEENAKLLVKIEQARNNLKRLQGYKTFLFLVKCRKIQLCDIDPSELINYGFLRQQSSRKVVNMTGGESKRTSVLARPSLKRKGRRSTMVINRTEKCEDEDFPPRNPEIFSSIGEFEEVMSNLEEEGVNLLKKYNNLTKTLSILSEENKEYSKNHPDIEILHRELLKEKETVLSNEKLKYSILNEDKKYLIESTVADKFSGFITRISRKVKEILFNLPIDLDKLFAVDKFYSNSTSTSNSKSSCYPALNCVHLLKILEKILVFYTAKMSEYSQSSRYKILMKECQTRIEKEKKVENNTKRILAEKLHIQQRTKKVLKKITKFVVLPKRKLGIEVNVNSQRKKIKNDAPVDEAAEFIQLSTY